MKVFFIMINEIFIFIILKSEGKIDDSVIFYELDLNEVVAKKINIISKHSELYQLINQNLEIKHEKGI